MLRGQRRGNECTLETREGDTYISNIGQEKKIPDITQIPHPTENMKQLTGDVSYVIIDLETGGLMRMSDILQISAVHNSKEFNVYVTPTQHISKAASNVTKLTVVNGQLHHKGNAVATLGINDAVQNFINFLKGIQKPVLVGHNIKTFDLIFLYNNLVKCDLWESFLSVVVGSVDTLLVFKKELPKRHSYKQEVLVAELLQESYSAHNAVR